MMILGLKRGALVVINGYLLCFLFSYGISDYRLLLKWTLYIFMLFVRCFGTKGRLCFFNDLFIYCGLLL